MLMSVLHALEAFLVIYLSLPLPVLTFVSLAIALVILGGVVRVVLEVT